MYTFLFERLSAHSIILCNSRVVVPLLSPDISSHLHSRVHNSYTPLFSASCMCHVPGAAGCCPAQTVIKLYEVQVFLPTPNSLTDGSSACLAWKIFLLPYRKHFSGMLDERSCSRGVREDPVTGMRRSEKRVVYHFLRTSKK